MPISLGELAKRFDCELIGDPDIDIDNVASLSNAGPGSLSFLSSANFKEQLATTRAAAVILRAEDADDSPTASLINENPYACYARMAGVIAPEPEHESGIHASATVSPSATIDKTACIAANAFIGDRSCIGANTYIGPGCVIGEDCEIGNDGHLVANVTLVRNVRMGARCILHPGVVIGSDGFGNAMTPEGWIKVPQLGGVVIGDDVEIGSNTTVDRGALDDTVIEDGVRLDNLIMIAHNVHIGAHTVMAAMVGIAGSTVIGQRCMFAGKSGAVGHVTICDDVVVSGKCMVTKDITESGVYASAFPMQPAREWNRTVARVRRLDKLAERVKQLEKDDK